MAQPAVRLALQKLTLIIINLMVNYNPPYETDRKFFMLQTKLLHEADWLTLVFL